MFNKEVKWSKEFGEKMVSKYEIVKKVYLDNESKNLKEKEIISKIELLLNEKYVKNTDEFESLLNENTILKYINEVDFNIRNISYDIKDKKIVIQNIVVLFLLEKENEFVELLGGFTN